MLQDLALPFVGLLYKPAGTAISYTSTSLGALSTGAEVYQAKTWTKGHAWSVLKNGAEIVGTIASLRIGLAVHTVMNLGENLYALREFNKLTWSQTGEKMLPVASNALYLLTLASFSTPVSYGIIGLLLCSKQDGASIKPALLIKKPSLGQISRCLMQLLTVQ